MNSIIDIRFNSCSHIDSLDRTIPSVAPLVRACPRTGSQTQVRVHRGGAVLELDTRSVTCFIPPILSAHQSCFAFTRCSQLFRVVLLEGFGSRKRAGRLGRSGRGLQRVRGRFPQLSTLVSVPSYPPPELHTPTVRELENTAGDRDVLPAPPGTRQLVVLGHRN